MSVTVEYLENLEFEIVKQKYYNANKVNAKLEELKTGVLELIEENEKLKKQAKDEQEEINAAGEALVNSAQQIADATIKDAQVKADKIIADAKLEAQSITAGARSTVGVAAAAGELTVAQLDLLDEINRQLDSLNKNQATQILKIKQRLMSVAIV